MWEEEGTIGTLGVIDFFLLLLNCVNSGNPFTFSLPWRLKMNMFIRKFCLFLMNNLCLLTSDRLGSLIFF